MDWRMVANSLRLSSDKILADIPKDKYTLNTAHVMYGVAALLGAIAAGLDQGVAAHEDHQTE